jgi:hypothetical protein
MGTGELAPAAAPPRLKPGAVVEDADAAGFLAICAGALAAVFDEPECPVARAMATTPAPTTTIAAAAARRGRNLRPFR